MTPATAGRILAIVATIVVVAAVIGGLAMLMSPAQQRAVNLDARRVEDLIAIQRAISHYRESHSQLPKNLAAVADDFNVSATDPVTRQPYVYETQGPEAYRLCAVFAADSKAQPDGGPPYYSGARKWAHGTGRSCFTRTGAETE